MFWLFFCMYILFLGAEVAMWLETSDVADDLATLRGKQPRRHAKKHTPGKD